MNNSQLIREVQAERSSLEVKKKLNEIKEVCAEMDDPEKGITCLREANNFEARIDQEFQPEHKLERVQKPQSPEKLIKSV